ncbi:hypothetical protein FHS82_002420 [Pseudochelatococcus lubricantis]|uniref:Uncharacterized protein n=1 Tax=Pseudochelatococcus lubricantis TaxID=1538102 RepID=A0ABX0V0R3_9HYPH|nr:hypothetical protein [Pseudochelatococcus lubricantis]NIJ58572.1 hypothetical protein [Pseudochelatococcus lubricantis]
MSFSPRKGVAETLTAQAGQPSEAGALDPANGGSRAETAAYVSQMSGELAALARLCSLDSVAYFLEMARREASSIEQE